MGGVKFITNEGNDSEQLYNINIGSKLIPVNVGYITLKINETFVAQIGKRGNNYICSLGSSAGNSVIFEINGYQLDINAAKQLGILVPV